MEHGLLIQNKDCSKWGPAKAPLISSKLESKFKIGTRRPLILRQPTTFLAA